MPGEPVRVAASIDPADIATRQDFADALTRARELAGLTLRDLERLTGVPFSTLAGYFGGRYLPQVKQAHVLLGILRACGVTDEQTLNGWLEAFHRVRRAPGPRPAHARAPYLSLASYQPEDAEWFFARRGLTGEVVARVANRWAAGAGPVMVVGPSGSGKSSLLRAGVIPALRAGGVDLPFVPVLLLTPGTDPVSALAEQLAAVTGTPVDEVVAGLRGDPYKLVEYARRAAGGAGLVVVVDQLEELFTECRDADERQVFISALAAAATDPDGNRAAAAVLLGLRADFYHRALREPRLASALRRSQVVVGPMSEDELREAIVGPARRAGLEVEDGLVEVLLRDLAPPTPMDGAAHEAGAMPLLSHALWATWKRSRAGWLTAADYRATGRIAGGVARTADEVVDALTPVERELARRLLVRLVRVGRDAPNTRRRVALEEVDRLLGDRRAVLEAFVERRLVTMHADAVEITHEALVAAWPRLRSWVDADRQALLVGQELAEAAQRWLRDGRDPGMLYGGARLLAAREWAEADGGREIEEPAREFLDASLRRERRRARLVYQAVATLAVLALLATAGGVVALQQRSLALHQRAAMTDERNLALSRMAAVRAARLADTDPALAAQLALAAYRIAPTVEARSSLLSASAAPAVTRMLGPDALLQTLAFDPRHHLLAAPSDDEQSVWLWDVSDPHRPAVLAETLPGVSGVVNEVALHPGRRLLAAAGTEKTIHLYDVRDPAEPVEIGPPLAGPDNTVHALAFSPDGTVLAAGAEDATVRLWDITDVGAPVPLGDPLPGPEASLATVAFSPDGRILVAGGHDASVHRWDVTNPRSPERLGSPLTGPSRAVYAVTFSPDGRFLAGGSADQRVYLWEVTGRGSEPARMFTNPSGSNWVHSVAVSPDGRTVAAGSSDGRVRLWNLPQGRVTGELPHPGPVTGLAFEPHGRALYTAASDGAVRRWAIPGPVLADPTGIVFDAVHHPHRSVVVGASGDGRLYLWDVADPQHPAVLGEPFASPDEQSALVGTVAVSPDGRTLASSSRDGTIWRWDITDPEQPRLLDPPLAELSTFAENLAFSPDSALLAAGAADGGVVQLWDLSDPARPEAVADVTAGRANVYSVVFHPDRPILAVGGFDRLVRLYDISDPRAPRLLGDPLAGPTGFVYSIRFSPDGDTMAVGSADKTVRFWDVTDPSRPDPGPVLTGPNAAVRWVAFSPDGYRLAAGSWDESVWLWDLTEPTQPAHYAQLTGPTNAVAVITYSSDGRTLVAGSNDTTVRLWRTDPQQVAAQVCMVIGDPITRQEWGEHIPGVVYDPPC